MGFNQTSWRFRTVIDLPEQIVVPLNHHDPGFQRERLLIGLAGLVELSLVFIRDSQVVPGRGVRRVELSRPVPPIQEQGRPGTRGSLYLFLSPRATR